MKTARYRIVSHWRVEARLQEVIEIFRDSESLADWWPAAFLKARTLAPGAEDEMGKRVWLHVKGWLPHTLQMAFEITESSYPESFTLTVCGDFEGGCHCRVAESRDSVELEFDWRVDVQKPLVRYTSWLLRPLFTWSHRWVMRRGQESLKLELERRRCGGAGVTAPPPGPTFPFDPVSTRLRSWFAAK